MPKVLDGSAEKAWLSAAVPVDTMWVYNISADSWSQSNATLSSPRSDLCIAAVNGTIYGAGRLLLPTSALAFRDVHLAI